MAVAAATPSRAEISAKLAAPGSQDGSVQRSSSVKHAPSVATAADSSRTTLGPKSNDRQQLAAIDETTDRPMPTQDGPSSGGEDSGPSDDENPLDQAQEARERKAGERGMRTEANIKSGYLMKKGERRKAWKKRFFVLRPKVICYYKNDKVRPCRRLVLRTQEYKLLRDIPLASVHTVAEVQVKRHDHVFGIVTQQRTYYVEAESRQAMLDWVRKMDEARMQAQRSQSEEQSLNTVDSKDLTPRDDDHTPTTEGRSQPIAIRQDSVTSSQLGGSYTSSGGDVMSSSLGSSSGLERSPVFSVAEGEKLASPRDEGGAFRLPPPKETRARQTSSGGGNSSGGESAGYFPRLNTNVPPAPAMIRSATGLQSSSDEEDDDDFVPPTPSVQGIFGSFPTATAAVATPSQPEAPRVNINQLDPRKVIMQGYLTKQGKRKAWRKRYFTLISSRLIYSHSHMDQKPARQIPLERIVDVLEYEPPERTSSGRSQSHSGQPLVAPVPGSPAAAERQYDNVFKIITAKRTYVVCAPDEDSLIKWISALRVLLQARRNDDEAAQSSVPRLNPPPIGRTPATPPTTSSSPPAPAPIASAPSRGSGAMPSIESKLQEADRPTHTRDRSLTNAAREAIAAVDGRRPGSSSAQ